MRLAGILMVVNMGACTPTAAKPRAPRAQQGAKMSHKYKVEKTDDEWRKILTPEQFHVLREKGTERAFTGAHYASHDKAMYVCAACGQELFKSDQKFDSGSGWPSFWAPTTEANVETETDSSHGMSRTEVRCSRCGGHLGHVFEDGPRPTGLRYCINSASIKPMPVDGKAAEIKSAPEKK